MSDRSMKESPVNAGTLGIRDLVAEIDRQSARIAELEAALATSERQRLEGSMLLTIVRQQADAAEAALAGERAKYDLALKCAGEEIRGVRERADNAESQLAAEREAREGAERERDELRDAFDYSQKASGGRSTRKLLEQLDAAEAKLREVREHAPIFLAGLQALPILGETEERIQRSMHVCRRLADQPAAGRLAPCGHPLGCWSENVNGCWRCHEGEDQPAAGGDDEENR